MLTILLLSLVDRGQVRGEVTTHEAHSQTDRLIHVEPRQSGAVIEIAARENKLNLKRAHSPPKIISQTNQHIVNTGRKVDLICEVRGTLVDMQIKWVVTHHDLDELEIHRPSSSLQILRIPTASAIHSGNYTCHATNPYGEAQLTFKVKVLKTTNMNFEVYVCFVGTTLGSLLLVLACTFSCGRYCCTLKNFDKLVTTIKGKQDHQAQHLGCEDMTCVAEL